MRSFIPEGKEALFLIFNYLRVLMEDYLVMEQKISLTGLCLSLPFPLFLTNRDHPTAAIRKKPLLTKTQEYMQEFDGKEKQRTLDANFFVWTFCTC